MDIFEILSDVKKTNLDPHLPREKADYNFGPKMVIIDRELAILTLDYQNRVRTCSLRSGLLPWGRNF